MLEKFFSNTIYVQISVDLLKAVAIDYDTVFCEKPLIAITEDKKGIKKVAAIGNVAATISNAVCINPFKHPRTILADFSAAQRLLQQVIFELHTHKFLKPSPAIIIHPIEKLEGGLLELERRAFEELALGAGARDVVVYQGEALDVTKINFSELKKQYKSHIDAFPKN